MDPIEHAMTVQALARGELRVRTAQGGDLPVPHGPVEIDFSDGLAHVRWKDAAGCECTRTHHPDEYERYVVAGWVQPSVK